jgi:hypothetical protein
MMRALEPICLWDSAIYVRLFCDAKDMSRYLAIFVSRNLGRASL